MSASFRFQRPLSRADCRDVWLWNWAERRLAWHIPVAPEPPTPWGARDQRLVIHGGGWAIGTYQQVLPELAASGYALDVLAPASTDWSGRGPSDRHFAPDPSWHPWHRNAASQLSYPPLSEVAGDGSTRWLPNTSYPPAHSLVRAASAVVSKPGGGTLIDALAAATPVVLLEPYGEAEARSGELWEQLGFGIRFERWRELGFDPEVLAQLHHSLLIAAPARTLPSYPRDAWCESAASGARAKTGGSR